MKIDGYRAKSIKHKNKKTKFFITENGFVYKENIDGTYKQLKCNTDKDGYKTIVINFGDKYKYFRVHRLVAQNFIKNPKRLKEVNHCDGDKTNNDVTNLEWCTRQENQLHAFEIGLTGAGEKSSNHKLTERDVCKICELLETTNKSYKEISKLIGDKCTTAMVKTICYKKSWVEISDKYDFSNRTNLTSYRVKNKLNKDTVHQICHCLETTDMLFKDIAAKFGTTYDQIANIKFRKTWKSISKEYKF